MFGFSIALVLGGAVAPTAAQQLARDSAGLLIGEILPTGQRITPTAAPGSEFGPLVPIPSAPNFTAGQAVELAVSPDGSKLLILTSGYNRTIGADGNYLQPRSTEAVFVYDIGGPAPVRRQAIPVPNTYNGIAWLPDGSGFLVSGGFNDVIRYYKWNTNRFVFDGPPLALGHKAGNGVDLRPMAAGIAVSPRGDRLLVANFANDSVSLVDLAARKVMAEQDLRPGKIDPSAAGVPGGEYPFAVAWASDTTAYVSSQRDRELVKLAVTPDGLGVQKRIKLAGQPNKMILSKDRSRLFVAVDNSDSVVVLEANDGDVLAEIPTAAPASVFANPAGLKGANPNNLALAGDGRTLFVTNGGLNAVAVLQLGRDVLADDDPPPQGNPADDDDAARLPAKTAVIGLIPTGWYPNAVAVAREGRELIVVNGKSNAGPNPGACRDNLSTRLQDGVPCAARNVYVWQLSKAGLLSMPVPDAAGLARLTLQVAANNHFPAMTDRARGADVMAALRARIHHVVYIVKENRTYDQVLGDLEIGNGDPHLTLLGEPLSPNHHALARAFVTLDNFFDTAESSNMGWVWSTAARTTDYTEKAGPVSYASRGLSYDQEGANRNINVGLPTAEARRRANATAPSDPDILPGTADVAAPDPPGASGGAAGTGYLWDAALRAGLSIRNYGFYGDVSRYDPRYAAQDGRIPLARDPFADRLQVFFPTKPSLAPYSDVYFRAFDMAFPDFWRVREWQREFSQQITAGNMPSLTLLRLPHDHFGSFSDGIDGVDTVETQMADNDYAIGEVVHAIAASPFAADTLIFILEDDAQNGADHVDAHRSIAFVVGPYVKHNALVSERYTTVNMLRTIEDVLGLPPLGLNDGLAEPMSEVFDLSQSAWTYDPIVPEALRSTKLPLEPPAQKKTERPVPGSCFAASGHDAAWWDAAMAGQDFSQEDKVDVARFNAALWAGLKGEGTAAPDRPATDLRSGRADLLAAWRKAQDCGRAH